MKWDEFMWRTNGAVKSQIWANGCEMTQAEYDRVRREKTQTLVQIWCQTGPDGGRQARDRVWNRIFAFPRVRDEAVETAVQTREQAKEEHDDPR
jgi:hypothetical protein